jgi:hypothetical protein
MVDLKVFNFWVAVAIFFGAAAVDAIWAQYTFHLTKRHSLTAATLSLVVALLAAVEIILYISNLWYVIPLAAGAFVGTFAVVEWEKRTNPESRK